MSLTAARANATATAACAGPLGTTPNIVAARTKTPPHSNEPMARCVMTFSPLHSIGVLMPGHRGRLHGGEATRREYAPAAAENAGYLFVSQCEIIELNQFGLSCLLSRGGLDFFTPAIVQIL